MTEQWRDEVRAWLLPAFESAATVLREQPDTAWPDTRRSLLHALDLHDPSQHDVADDLFTRLDEADDDTRLRAITDTAARDELLADLLDTWEQHDDGEHHDEHDHDEHEHDDHGHDGHEHGAHLVDEHDHDEHDHDGHEYGAHLVDDHGHHHDEHGHHHDEHGPGQGHDGHHDADRHDPDHLDPGAAAAALVDEVGAEALARLRREHPGLVGGLTDDELRARLGEVLAERVAATAGQEA